MPKKAILRTCASCEWIFKLDNHTEYSGCPKCGFAHYSARYVYGNSAYRYAKNQSPWMEKQISDFTYKLMKEINVC